MYRHWTNILLVGQALFLRMSWWEDGGKSDSLTGFGFTNQCSTAVEKEQVFLQCFNYYYYYFLFLKLYEVHSELTWNTAYCTTVFVFNYLFSFCMTKM